MIEPLRITTTMDKGQCTVVVVGEVDMATVSDRGCSCGRPGRVVAGIDGRLEDYIVLRNGTKLGRLDHLFKDMINIREAQICQRSSGDLLIRVVPSDRYTDADERTLLSETRLRVGESVEIEIARVEKIERTANGKLRFVVSESRES